MKSSVIALILVALLVGVACGVGGYAFIYAKGYSYLLNDPVACSKCPSQLFQQLGQDLQSGQLSAAQQADGSLQQEMQMFAGVTAASSGSNSVSFSA